MGWASHLCRHETAQADEHEIDDRIARYVALQLHSGQGSALYSLASCGAIDEERIGAELAEAYEQQPEPVRVWIDRLVTYFLHREDKGPVAELNELPSWIGWVRNANVRHVLMKLSGETPDEQVGSVDELSWLGLYRHGDRSGGVILSQDEKVFVSCGRQTQLRSYKLGGMRSGEGMRTSPGAREGWEGWTGWARQDEQDRLRIYVASLSDYNAGWLYGRWINADQEAEEIQAEIAAMLAESPTAGAEDWAVHDYESFGGYQVGEYESVETMSRIAKVIAEHDEAFTLCWLMWKRWARNY
jgi:hypothetical protein